MTALRCIAVDDEPIALDVVRHHAAKVPFLDLQHLFVSAVEAVAWLRQHPVDLVFLDVNMPDLTGLDVARLLPPGTLFVFTTAYAEHALRGFELNAVDYLVKPLDFGRFLEAAQRARDRQPAPDGLSRPGGIAPSNVAPGQTATLFVKDGYDYVRLVLSDVAFIESDGNYLTFYGPPRKVVTRMTVAEALQHLPGGQFMRVHKSYIVNLAQVDKIERHQLTLGKQIVPLAATYREELLGRIQVK